jgi:4-hydroxy-3-methylbut-2-enyl diphosphate reductase
MEVLLADEYGFCFGVERAVEMVEEVVEEGARPIRSLGPLIHNAQEMERLGARGVSTIDLPEEADADTIAVIRAHGVTPQVQRELEQRAAKVIDATCPFVTRVQHLAERAARQGRDVVVAGNPDHPEMIGVVGYAPDNTYVVRDAKEVAALPPLRAPLVVSQTTIKLQTSPKRCGRKPIPSRKSSTRSVPRRVTGRTRPAHLPDRWTPFTSLAAATRQTV